MSDTGSKQMQDIEALLAERRKFELWIDQLIARRVATPPAVYDKVHADYSARLADAQSRLAAETDAIAAHVDRLETSLATHDATISGKSDELAEAELRAAVGEYSEKEWNKLREKLSTAIAGMTKERDSVLAELESMRSVLAEASSTTPAAVKAEVPAAAPVEPPAASPPVAVEPRVSAPAAHISVPAAAVMEEPPAAKAAPAPAPAEPAAQPPKDRDELAFLRSVLGRSTPATNPQGLKAIDEAPSAPSRRSIGSASSRASTGASSRPVTPGLFEAPEPLEMPADQARESGAFSRASGSFTMPTSAGSEAVKSLKCQECGTLNYPTEWYCERCGGELAAF